MTPNFDIPFCSTDKIQDAHDAHRQASDRLLADADPVGRAASVLQRDFASVDTNKDGLVSRKELRLFNNPDRVGGKLDMDKKDYAYLDSRFDDIVALNDDQTFFETKISRTDLDQLRFRESGNLTAVQNRYSAYEKIFSEDFAILDKNKSGGVTEDELEMSLKNAPEGAINHQAYKFFLDNYDEITKAFGGDDLDIGDVKEAGKSLQKDHKTVYGSVFTGMVTGGVGFGTAVKLMSDLCRVTPDPTRLAISVGVGAVLFGALAFAVNRHDKKYVPPCQIKLFDTLNNELRGKDAGAPNYYDLPANRPGFSESSSVSGSFKSETNTSKARSILEGL